MSRTRYRAIHKFWLDRTKADEGWLDDQLGELKRVRKYTGVLRDALRLIFDLRQGRLDVLFEMFPWVRAELASAAAPARPAETELQRQLARLEQLLMERGGVQADAAPVASAKLAGLAPLATVKMDDDEADGALVTIRKDTSSDAARNFLQAALSLQQ